MYVLFFRFNVNALIHIVRINPNPNIKVRTGQMRVTGDVQETIQLGTPVH